MYNTITRPSPASSVPLVGGVIEFSKLLSYGQSRPLCLIISSYQTARDEAGRTYPPASNWRLRLRLHYFVLRH